MEELENYNLAVVTQFPKIKENFSKIHEEVLAKTNVAMKLAVTEDNLADIKKVRAELNKEFQIYEAQRKAIKKEILAPYEFFNDEYEKAIADTFKNADNRLKSKINDVEDNIKDRRVQELKIYFRELCEEKNMSDILKWEDIDVKIGLSSTISGLRKLVKEQIEKVENELKVIDVLEDKTEILAEYLSNGFNYFKAVQDVAMRKARLKKIQDLQEEKEELDKKDEEYENQIRQDIVIEEVEDEDISFELPMLDNLVARFEVEGTKEQLIALREYLNENNIKFKNI